MVRGPLVGDDLLVILGQEVVTETGHWLALSIEFGQVIDSRYGQLKKKPRRAWVSAGTWSP